MDPLDLANEHMQEAVSKAAAADVEPTEYLRNAAGMLLTSGFMMALKTDGPKAASQWMQDVLADFSRHIANHGVPCKVQIAEYDGPGTDPLQRG
jgi:hypothetical protein